jgi:hypothetical protein
MSAAHAPGTRRAKGQRAPERSDEVAALVGERPLIGLAALTGLARYGHCALPTAQGVAAWRGPAFGNVHQRARSSDGAGYSRVTRYAARVFPWIIFALVAVPCAAAPREAEMPVVATCAAG